MKITISLRRWEGMAVPFRRTSKTVKRKRRTHFKLSVPGTGRVPKLW